MAQAVAQTAVRTAARTAVQADGRTPAKAAPKSGGVSDWRMGLAATRWKRLERVRAPHRAGVVLIEQVVIGPSGVYVVTGGSTPGHHADTRHASSAPRTVGAARAAADAVRAVVPERYRHLVRAVLCVGEGVGDGPQRISELAAGVLLADPATLHHTMRHGPRVLSTSEVLEVHGTLIRALSPARVAPVRTTRPPWWRRPAPMAGTLLGAAALATLTEPVLVRLL